jgi:hypothetical protein
MAARPAAAAASGASTAGPGTAGGESDWGAGWLPLDNELTLLQLRLEAQAVLSKLAFDLQVDSDGGGRPDSYSAEVGKQADALANAGPGEVAQQWAALATVIQDFDLHIQDSFALGPQTVACGYLLGRALADAYWALDPSLPDGPADPASWSFLFGSKRSSETQRLLGRLSGYFHPYTAAAIAGSVQVWHTVATTAPGLRMNGGAYSKLYQQIRHWYELVLLEQDPTTLLKPYQLLRHLGLVWRAIRLFWAQLLLAALAAAALAGFAWLLSRPDVNAGLTTLLGALGITGISVAGLATKLKNDAQAMITRIKQDAYTDLIVVAITTAPIPGPQPTSGPFQGPRSAIAASRRQATMTKMMHQRSLTPVTPE